MRLRQSAPPCWAKHLTHVPTHMPTHKAHAPREGLGVLEGEGLELVAVRLPELPQRRLGQVRLCLVFGWRWGRWCWLSVWVREIMQVTDGTVRPLSIPHTT